ncbi:MAG: hypothetical protein COB67_00105 [SAR324 cluster bacterium]|uniref:Uncharacterized protein n=1 Tax=SAR324 cluster bacterium TaxID=2024889 RepID=A0A2A4TC07_9DELT|nr:MAG: hypothetical protein COB67_00105 [SAR324 cluster bacterium]
MFHFGIVYFGSVILMYYFIFRYFIRLKLPNLGLSFERSLSVTLYIGSSYFIIIDVFDYRAFLLLIYASVTIVIISLKLSNSTSSFLREAFTNLIGSILLVFISGEATYENIFYAIAFAIIIKILEIRMLKMGK